jgi:hypothetical protein
MAGHEGHVAPEIEAGLAFEHAHGSEAHGHEGLRKSLGQGLAHADRLAALPRKDQSPRHPPPNPVLEWRGTGIGSPVCQRARPFVPLRCTPCPV